MPSLDQRVNDAFIKLMYIGDSSTGKTGSLVSLVKAGYKLRVLDYDVGIGTLASYIKQECPDKLSSVDVITLRDKYRATSTGPMLAGTPTAFTGGLKYLTEWEDKSVPSEWGPEYILVLDSLSAMGRAAMAWARFMNNISDKKNNDARALYFTAQQAIEDIISMLTSDAFATNVIIISHINYKEVTEGKTKGYANAIGTALGPIIPRYFNTLIMAETSGMGKSAKRVIKTVPTGIVDLKNPVSFKLDESLPLGTGLATLFEKIKEL